MMKLAVLLAVIASPTLADTVFAARNLRSQSVISQADVVLKDGELPGTAKDLSEVIGRETTVMLYAGRPILIEDLAAPALVERNRPVVLVFSNGGLTISTEGRALERGAEGDLVKAMNLSSRSTVSGTVTATGEILIGH